MTEGSNKYIVPMAVKALEAVTAEDPAEEESLLEACADYLFTAEKLIEEGKLIEKDDNANGDQGTNDNKENSSDKFVSNNNQIVLVTYGERDAETFDKYAYKSFILNYNNYAVVVEFEGIVYTIPRGGYVVLYHN